MAELAKKKLRWPDRLRINNVYFLSFGKSLIGLYPFMKHNTIATGNPARLISNVNSIGLKPFSDYVLNTARQATVKIAQKLFAKNDMHLLSPFSSTFLFSVCSSENVSRV